MAKAVRYRPRRYVTLSPANLQRVEEEYPPRSLSRLIDQLLAKHFREKDISCARAGNKG